MNEVEVAADLVEELAFPGAALKTGEISFGDLAGEEVAILRDGVEMKRLQGSRVELPEAFGIPVFVELGLLFQNDLDGLGRRGRNDNQK